MKITINDVIKSGTIEQQKELLGSLLALKIKMVDEKINNAEKSKEIVFTERQLNFSKDDAQAICNKFWNKDFETKKTEILSFIKKKFEKNSKTKLLSNG